MAESIFKDNFRVPFKNIQSKKGVDSIRPDFLNLYYIQNIHFQV